MTTKYLKIAIVGHSDVMVYANEQKKSHKDPDYRAPGVAVWVNKSRNGESGQLQSEEA